MRSETVLNKFMMFPVFGLFLILKVGICIADDAEVRRVITDAIEQFEAVDDYTCSLDKRIRKNNTLYEDLDISVKYKKNKHYYFRWNRGIAKGREVIFVEGKYGNKLVAHPGGLMKFITLHLDPEGHLAMKENQHSLRNSGMEKIMSLIESNYELAEQKGLDAIRLLGKGNINGKSVWEIRGCFPEDLGFYAHKIYISFCSTLKLPLKVSIYDWRDQLVEEYVFRDLRINVGLDEDDFSPSNPHYHYFGS